MSLIMRKKGLLAFSQNHQQQVNLENKILLPRLKFPANASEQKGHVNTRD